MARPVTFVNVPPNTTPPAGAPRTNAANLNKVQDESVEVLDEGTSRGNGRAINFTGSGVSAVWNSGASRFDVTVAGISGATAAQVTFTPTGSIASTTVQDAIAEVAAEAAGTYSLPDASTSVKGGVTLSTAPASASAPIAAGTNDGRIPSQGENDALAGTNGTPSDSNRFVTNADPRNSDARTPTAHTHPTSAITGLDTALAALLPKRLVIEDRSATTAYTLVAADAYKLKRYTGTSAVTWTVPASVFVAGDWVDVIEAFGAGQVTLAAGAGFTLRSRDGWFKTAGDMARVQIYFISATEAYLTGDTAL